MRLGKALRIRQQIGHRAGEGDSFLELGLLAKALGRRREALNLVALVHVLLERLGHAHARRALDALHRLASELNYRAQEVDALVRSAESHRDDRGSALLTAAFGLDSSILSSV